MNISTRWQLPAFIASKVVLNTIVRMVYPFLRPIAAGLGVDIVALSRTVALRSMTGALGPFVASIAERRGRKTGLVLGLLIFSLGAGVMAVYPSLPSFAAAMILTFLGNLIFTPSLQAYLGDHIPYARRGRALALTETGWSLAFILAVPAMGFLMLRFGWTAPFPVLTVSGLLMAGLLAWMLPADTPPRPGAANLWRNLGSVFIYPPALAGMMLGLSLNAANEVVNLVFGVWLGDSFGLDLAGLGATAAVIGFSELGGELLSSGFVDRLGKRRSIAAGLLLNSAAAIGLTFIGRSTSGALVGLALFYITYEFTLVSSLPLMTEVMPQNRATLMAFFVGFTALGRAAGALLAPGLYAQSMLISGLTAAAINGLALLALRWAKPVESPSLEPGQERV